jgi:hypothetical protein
MSVRLSALCASRPLPLWKIPSTHFCYRLSSPQGHSAAGRIRSIEKTHLIGTRTRYLPACSIVPQPTMLLRALCDRQLFLRKTNIQYEKEMRKWKLIDLVKQNHLRIVFSINEMLEEHEFRPIRSPPYHPDLNPTVNVEYAKTQDYGQKRGQQSFQYINNGTISCQITRKILLYIRKIAGTY